MNKIDKLNKNSAKYIRLRCWTDVCNQWYINSKILKEFWGNKLQFFLVKLDETYVWTTT